MKKMLFETQQSLAPTLLRIALGLILLPHGLQKLTGWFGGYGFSGTMQFFTETLHLPWLIGFTVILLETLGALLLIAGLATRPLAALFIILFAGIILTTHLPNGFFMNWFNNQAGEGYEYALLVIAMSASLLISGGGRYAADSALVKAA